MSDFGGRHLKDDSDDVHSYISKDEKTQIAGDVVHFPRVEIVPAHNTLTGKSGFKANVWRNGQLEKQGTNIHPTEDAARKAALIPRKIG